MSTISHSNLFQFNIFFFFSFLSFSVFHFSLLLASLFWSMFKICIYARRPTLKSTSSEQQLASTKMWTQVSYVYVAAKVNERVNICFFSSGRGWEVWETLVRLLSEMRKGCRYHFSVKENRRTGALITERLT